jgi:hypothetical protein
MVYLMFAAFIVDQTCEDIGGYVSFIVGQLSIDSAALD